MNSKSLSYLSVLAVLAGSILLPVSAITVAITFTVAGVLAILYADYGSEISPLRAQARPIAFQLPAAPSGHLRQAA